MVRAVEARFYRDIELPPPTLDLGCGDGHFASVAFNRRLEVGLDPGIGPVREANQRCAYSLLVQADGASLPFSENYFASAVSNSVLEHISQVDVVLHDLGRVLKRGARFIFCVPNQNFLNSLSIGRGLDQLGFRRAGQAYRIFFNRISRHYHCDPPQVWEIRLDQAGFTIERWWNYFSPRAFKYMEWGHYFGLPSLVSRVLSGRWILVPTGWNLALTRRLTQRFYDEDPVCAEGVYTFYIARRI